MLVVSCVAAGLGRANTYMGCSSYHPDPQERENVRSVTFTQDFGLQLEFVGPLLLEAELHTNCFHAKVGCDLVCKNLQNGIHSASLRSRYIATFQQSVPRFCVVVCVHPLIIGLLNAFTY